MAWFKGMMKVWIEKSKWLYKFVIVNLIWGVIVMLYTFMTLEDQTEIVHSELLNNGEIKVYMERPDKKDVFHHATCFLPSYRLEDVFGFSEKEMDYLLEIIKSTEHLIKEFSTKGGIENASAL